MALQKSYLVKIFGQDGTTFKKNIPQGPGGLKNIPTFRSRLNGGFSECVLDLDLPWDNFGEGVSIAFMNIVEIWCQDGTYPLGRRIYKGFISQYAPYFDSRKEGVQVTLLGLVALLSRSFYKNGTNFTVTQAVADPQAIGEAVVDHFNTIFGGSLITYTHGTSTQTVGANVSYTFTDQKWIDALSVVQQLSGTSWWWSVDRDGLYNLKAKPSSATHSFTVGKDIDSMTAPKNSEKVINDVQVRWNNGSPQVSNYTDATSQTTYGTGGTPTGKYSEIVQADSSGSTITSSTGADQRGNLEINNNKNSANSAVLVISNAFDIEKIQVGDTCKILNYNKDSTFFSNNLMIVAMNYNGDTAQLELEQMPTDLGTTLSAFVKA